MTKPRLRLCSSRSLGGLLQRLLHLPMQGCCFGSHCTAGDSALIECSTDDCEEVVHQQCFGDFCKSQHWKVPPNVKCAGCIEEEHEEELPAEAQSTQQKQKQSSSFEVEDVDDDVTLTSILNLSTGTYRRRRRRRR